MEIVELKRHLAPHSRSICRDLFPDGKVVGGNFRIGNVRGEAGDSMSIRLDGEAQGTWTDFESGDHGDLLDLIQINLGITLKESMEWSRKKFGIKDTVTKTISPVTKSKKWTTPKPPKQSMTGELHPFLEKRGFLSKDLGDICYKYKIYETEEVGKGVDVVFQLFNSKGKLSYLKSKPINYDGHPSAANNSGMKPCLYGWHTLDPNSRTLWIVEGEMDMIAAQELGFPALSMPNGSAVNANPKNEDWIQYEWEDLERFEEIVLATDQDKAGDECAIKLSARLGERCLRVRFPAKDINDLLLDHGADTAKKILEDCYKDAKWQDPSQLQSVSNFADDIDKFFEAAESSLTGFASGFDKLDSQDIRFRSGELWGLTGINGSGKSMWLNQLALNAIKQNKKVLIASMEMTPRYTLGRMMRQVTAQTLPDKELRGKSLDWLSPHLWLYVDTLTPKPDDLLKVFKYAYQRYGIDIFIVDSMTNLVRHDDYEGQQKLMEKLVSFKLAYNVTMFLVTHARKGESEAKAPGKFDVKGSGAITDLADGFMSVWKNKSKAEHLHICNLTGETPDEDVIKKPDIILEVLKNRHGMYEGKSGFYFDNASCQYVERQGSSPTPYVKPKREKPF